MLIRSSVWNLRVGAVEVRSSIVKQISVGRRVGRYWCSMFVSCGVRGKGTRN